MAAHTRENARRIAASGNGAGRVDVKALARAGGLNFDGLSLEASSSNNSVTFAPATNEPIYRPRLSEGKSQTSAHTISDGLRSPTQTASLTVDTAGQTSAVGVGGAMKLTAIHNAESAASELSGSSTPLPLINSLTTTETGATVESLSKDLSAKATAATETPDSSASITGTSGGNFESLLVGSGMATAQVADTTSTATVTLDDAVAGGTPGTATITAHVNQAVTGSNLLLNLSNGATITIAVGATSGTSASFGALADAMIGINSHSGGNFEALDTSDTALVAVNNAPVNGVPGAQTVAEDTNLAITGLSISDLDAGSASNITTTLSVAHGTLTVSSAGGAAVSGSGTGSVTLTGSIAQINTTLAAVNNVVYKGVPDFNGSDTLTITANDQGNTGIDPGLTGTASSEQDSDTLAITVTAVNDAPGATITPTSYSATEQTSLSLKNNGLSIGDVDAATGATTATLSVTEGTLTVTAGSSGALVSNSGTSSVTVMGTVAQINDLLNTNGSSTVSYSDNTDTPSAGASLTLTVHDNGNTGGGDLSASDTATINITAVNDAPVLSLTPVFSHNVQDQFASQAYNLNTGDVNWSSSWTESESTSPTLGSIRIVDDPNVGGTNLTLRFGDDTNTQTADVTITRGANLTGAASSTLSFDYDQISADTGEDLIVNAWNGSAFVEIGRILGSSADGLGTFSVALDSAYISANTQIQLVAMGALDSNEFYYVDNVNIAYTNQPQFTEGGTAVVLDASATVSDVELDAANTYSGSTLTLARDGAANAQDVFSGSGLLSLNGGNVVYDSTTVGTYTQSGGVLVITFDGAATSALVDTVLQNIAYSNTSDAPPASVQIAYTFSDGNSGAQGSGGALSSSGSVTVSLTGVNDAPVVSGLAMSESSIGFVATDPDNATLSLISPFAAPFGNPTISSGVTTNLTPTQQGSAVSGTLQVTDGSATVSVVGLYLGSNAGNTVTAGASDTAVYGFNGNDNLTGGSGNDWIFGGSGNDTIVGAQNDSLLDGGAGTDTLSVAADLSSISDGQIANIENVTLTAAATLNLSNQSEGFTLTGSSGADTITGGSGSDRITGGSGNDTIVGAQNDSLLDGGTGTDTLSVGANLSSTSNGQIANIENVTLTAAATLNLSNQSEGFTLTGSSGADIITAGSGNDTITGGDGADAMTGGSGNDTIVGAQNDSLLDGGAGTDTLSVGADLSSISDGQIANIENLTLTVAATLNLSNQSEGFTLTGSSGADAITGGSGADAITGGDGADTITGGSGNDTIVGAENDVVLDGGVGTDTLNVGANFSSISDEQIANIENATLTASGLTFNLSNQTEGFTITGSSGADAITAGSGNDIITGGAGGDTMTGGSGADTFVISTGQSTVTLGGTGNSGTITGYDVIADFATASDTLNLQGTAAAAANTAGANGTDSGLTVGGQTVKSHAITNGIATFDDNNAFNAASIFNLTSLANVAAVVDYLNGNDIGTTGTTVAFTASIGGVAHTFIYEQISSGTPTSTNNYLLVDLANVTLTSGGTSLSSLISAGRIAPAGVAGQPINLALTDPADHVGAVTVTISSVPAGWSLSEGSDNGDGTWRVETEHVGALSITSPADYAGAMAYQVTMSWTNADGSSGFATLVDNVEAYAPGNPIFAISGDDNLTGSTSDDLMVFAQPISHDIVHNFDVAQDKIDLIGFAGTTSFADVLAHLANDSNGDAVLTVGDGMTITFSGVDAGALSSDDFVFDQEPVTTNAGSMVVGDGAILPLSGIVENTGTITLDSVGSVTELQIIQNGITLQGGGSLVLSDSGANVISGTAMDVLFTNVDNTIFGAGQLGEGHMMLVNHGTIVASGANALEIDTGTGVAINFGTLEATGTGGLVIRGDLSNSGLLWANGGDIAIDGDVTGSGTALIDGNATVGFGGLFAETITIGTSASGTLVLSHAADFGGRVAGFDGDDHFVFVDIAEEAATLSYTGDADATGGVLTVSDGTHAANVALLGQYEAEDFQIAADAARGTAIVYVAHNDHVV